MGIEITIADLRRKEVINITDGKRLGRICDMVIDAKSGRICGVIVPGRGGGFIGKSDELYIPWCDICKIGDDVIIVELKAICPPIPGKPPRPPYPPRPPMDHRDCHGDGRCDDRRCDDDRHCHDDRGCDCD